MEFDVGQRVVVISDNYSRIGGNHGPMINKVGTIMGVQDSRYVIQFDDMPQGFGNDGGEQWGCTPGRWFYVAERDLEECSEKIHDSDMVDVFDLM